MLGKLSTCIYFTHWNVMMLIKYFMQDESYHFKLYLLFMIAIIVAFIVMWVGDGLKLWFRKRKQMVKGEI